MAKFSMDELKKNFAQKTSSGDQDWKKFFPFWKMPEDTQVVIRFLPDLDEDNGMGFLVENLTHELTVNGEKKKVPCLSMYGEPCPVCELSRKFYDAKDEETGYKYYKKRSYVGQVLVIECPFEYEHEPLVKLIEFGPKIFKQIQAAFQSGDLEEAPFELKGGYNFRIKKTKSGKWADYGTSNFSPKQTDVDDSLLEKIELFNLADYRTKIMDRSTIEAMVLADQTGEAFNASENENDSEAAPQAPVPQTKKESVSVQEPVESTSTQEPTTSESAPAETPSVSPKASAVLEQLRARAAAKKASA